MGKLGVFLLFDTKKHKHILRRFSFIGEMLEAVFPFTAPDIEAIDTSVMPSLFLTNAFISSFIFAFVFSAIIYYVASLIPFLQQPLLTATIIFLYLLIMLLILNVIHPHAYKLDLAKRTDRDLSFMLKDIIIQVKSGVLLYDALVAVTSAHSYGEATRQLKEVINKLNQGYTYKAAMEDLASKINSEFMKKVLWQFSSIFTVGGNATSLFESMERVLQDYHEREIKHYLDVANLVLFVYLLFGAVLPGIFLVSGVVLSVVLGTELSNVTIIGVLGLSLLIQVFLVGYLKTSKPLVME